MSLGHILLESFVALGKKNGMIRKWGKKKKKKMRSRQMHLKGILAPLILYGVIRLQLSERTCCSSHDIASDTHLLTGGQREREAEKKESESERL